MNNNDKRWHRKWNLDMTAEEVQKIVDETVPEDARKSMLRGPYTPEDSDALTGCCLKFRGEDHVLEWTFLEKNKLQLVEDGLAYEQAYCQVLTMDGVIFLVHSIIKEAVPLRAVDLVVDMATGNATVLLSQIGTKWSARDVDCDFLFGRIEGEFEKSAPLHGFTNDMLGRAIVWTYRDGDYEVRHIYNTNHYYTYTMQTENGSWVASNPADYIKVNDHTFIFTFAEERQPGIRSIFVMDLEKLHDIGAVFGIGGRERLLNSCFGAVGKEMPMTQVFE